MTEKNSLSQVLDDIERNRRINDDTNHVHVVFIPAGDDQNNVDENFENNDENYRRKLS